MRGRTLALALGLILAPALVGATPRKDVPREAKQLAAKGRAAHAAGAYGDAIIAYEAAYELAPSPSLLFNLAQAYRLAGDCPAAATMYRRFIAADPASDARALATVHLAAVERCAAGEAPARGASSTLAVDHPGLRKQRAGVGFMIGGGVAFALATYFALDAHAASSDVEDAYARGAPWQSVRATAERGDRSASIATGFAVAGGFAVASGITLYVLGKRAERAVPAALVPTRGGAEVSVAWQF
jgi:tetratricopeptide (TPR) repeat protein